MVVILMSVLLLQCFPAAFAGRFGECLSRKVSAKNTEVLSEEYSIEIFDGASGEITADMVMPDLIFKPEENGAWALDMWMEKESRVTVFFDAIIYKWQYGNFWERVDYMNGPGESSQDDGTGFLYRKLHPQYYQKGCTYKIRFFTNAEEVYKPEIYHYTFQKTEFAGCQDGLIWRTYNNWIGYGSNDGINENIRCTGYIGNETILQVPDQINGYVIDAIGSEAGMYSISNEYLQVLILGEGVDYINSLAGCKNLKDIYVYNKDCWLADYALPLFYIEGSGKTYYDTIIHGYAGGNLEKGCLERDYLFEPLPESIFSSPLPTETPRPSPAPSVLPDIPAFSPAIASQPVETDYSITSSSTSDREDNGTASPSPLSGLKVSTDHYTRVTLTWKPIPGTSYQIYRSGSSRTGYKRIKKNIKKNRYQDASVKSGESYYYRIRAVKTGKNGEVIQAEAQTGRIKIRALARPVVQIRKKQDGGIRYLWIRLKKFQGKRIEIYYKDSEWSSYRKIKLYDNQIHKQKGIFRIQCMSTKKLYLKVRTYKKKNGKKVYSLYTRAKKIRT